MKAFVRSLKAMNGVGLTCVTGEEQGGGDMESDFS